MVLEKQDITNMIRERVLQKDPTAKIILFGSRARDNAQSDSDWDILILIDKTPVSRLLEKEFRDELFEVELEIGQPISTFVFSKTEWEGKYKFTPLYNNIKEEGLLLK